MEILSRESLSKNGARSAVSHGTTSIHSISGNSISNINSLSEAPVLLGEQVSAGIPSRRTGPGTILKALQASVRSNSLSQIALSIFLFLIVFFLGDLTSRVLLSPHATESSRPEVLSIVALLLLVPGFFYLSRRFRILDASLSDLEEAVLAFGRGYYSRKLPDLPAPEMQPLVEAMNSLGTRLDSNFRALVKLQEQQRTTLAIMREGLLVLDSDLRVLSMNNAAAKLLGVSAQGALGKDIRSFPTLNRFASDSSRSGTVVEFQLPAADGSERWIRACITSLSTDTQKSIGTVIELTDMTDQKRFEQARQDFVANVSHELNTPITSIQGYVETLLDGGEHAPEDRERFLRIISGQANRLSSIVVELLSLARLESEQRLDPSSLSDILLQDVLRSVCDVCQIAATKKSIIIYADCVSDLRVRMNRWLIEQAIINLTENAIKYSGPNTVVKIVARMESRLLVIDVSDEGPGIAPEHLPRLFERFYRVDQARNRDAGGSGLGLAIVKHIAAVHGGKVLVESEVNKGSTFSIVIPS